MKFNIVNSSITNARKPKLDEYLRSYIDHLRYVADQNTYDAPESSINLPFDQTLLGEVQNLASSLQNPHLKYIFVVGIGGSNLGTKAVYDALFGYTDNLERATPQIIFLDTPNPAFLEKIQTFADRISSPEEVLINVISKSGTTTETIMNANILCEALEHQIEELSSRIVVTTDEQSKLWYKADKEGMHRLAIPEQVGGRYSVLSAVGLFPLAAAGIDIENLRQGAADMRSRCLEHQGNPALMSAQVIYDAYENGAHVADQFVFNAELASLGQWYRQLMGESLGKEHNLAGKTVNAGLTPTVSVGSTDLHSVGQLYLGGPNDKITTFISALPKDAPTNPRGGLFDGLVSEIDEQSASDVMSAILEGVKTAYTKQNLPALELTLEEIVPYHLGEFLQFKMIEIMLLGKLMNVNAFNQPHVELYKEETRRLLTEQE